ncbi:GAF domain-containing protein [Pseudorhodoferax sp.]|uniref:GAF domain-containing protein n=1 Tax=Pseudorhodoferax sp. TaxID=1993553 RepID=UPI002DD6542E|nr:GAF domain-containing protein [Pseudorhodoferax sp.]
MRQGWRWLWRAFVQQVAKIPRPIWLALSGLVIAIVMYFTGETTSDFLKRDLSAIGLVLFITGLSYQYLGKWLEYLIKLLFYMPVQKRVAQVSALTGEARVMADRSTLFDYVAKGIDQVFQIQGTGIYAVNSAHFQFVGGMDGEPVHADDPLIVQVYQHERWRRRDAAVLRTKINAPLVWPLIDGGRIVGLLLAGRATDELPRFTEAEEAEAVVPLCNLLATALRRTKRLDPKGEVFLKRAQHFAAEIAHWFEAKFVLMVNSAKGEVLSSTAVEKFLPELSKLAEQLGPAFNGVYVLDQNGIMLDHDAPPTVQIRGQGFSHRSYFQDCIKKMAPVVCDMIDAADRADRGRPVQILVLAVPRKNARGSLIGIVDAVIDLPSDPFSQMAVQARDVEPLPEHLGIPGVRIILIDSAAMVLGKSDSHWWKPRASVDEHPIVKQLREGLTAAGGYAYANEYGAIVPVEGTAFFAIAYESNDPADRPKR